MGDLLFEDLALFDLGGLADAITQVVELGATYATEALGFDLQHAGAVIREDALDAFAFNDAANGKATIHATVASNLADNSAGEDLNALFVAFFNAGMHVNGVTNIEVS